MGAYHPKGAWPLLAVTAALALVAAFRLFKNDTDLMGGVALIVGLIILGSWLSLEVISFMGGRGRDAHVEDSAPDETDTPLG